MTNTFKNQKIRSGTSYEAQLQALQDQIDSISKNITYLDVYNIIDTVEAKDELNVKVAGLISNSSLVINCPTFQEGDEEYVTGDIVLKNNNGEVIHIEAQPGGAYYPKNISNSGNNVTIQYNYAPSTPNPGSKYQATEQKPTADSPAEIMSFPLNFASGDKFIYGEWTNEHRFTKYEKVTPQIQVWLVDDDSNPVEQVYCDFVLSEGSGEYEGKYIVSNIPTGTWIKVK